MNFNLFISYLLESLIILLCLPLLGSLIQWLIEFCMTELYKVFGKRITDFLVNKLTFIGVIQHESAHALLGILTGAKVTKIVFFNPEKDRLGYIIYQTRGMFIFKAIQDCLVGVAPTLIGVITLLISFNYLEVLHYNGFLIYYMVSVFLHMNMSKSDTKNFFRGFPIVLIILFIVFCVLDRVNCINYFSNINFRQILGV